MQKCISLFLFIVSPTILAMENHSPKKIFSALHLRVRINKQATDASVLIQELCTKRSRFEEQLLETQLLVTKYIPELLTMQDFVDKVDANPGQFLSYCYYQKFYRGTLKEFLKLHSASSLLNRCKQAQIDGYSALGAALVAKKSSDKAKGKFIRKLIACGFEFTPKDRELATFELYENIPVKQKRLMMHMLSAFGQGDLLILPYDIRKIIVSYILHFLEKNHQAI